MNDLTVINYKGKYVIDSRMVADMVDKPHDQLLRSIRVFIEYLESAKMQSQEFFIPDTYTNTQNKEQPCYLLTRKGCDMVANKMTGEKGVIFTAMYVTKFEEMENAIKEAKLQIPMTIEDMIIAQAQSVKELKSKVEEIDIKSEHASEQAELAHKRINELDNVDTIGDTRQRLVRTVQKYAERNGLTYSQGWKDFRQAFNTAFRTNLTARRKYYMESRNIKVMTVPEYLEATNQLPDALRVANKMLQPRDKFTVV